LRVLSPFFFRKPYYSRLSSSPVPKSSSGGSPNNSYRAFRRAATDTRRLRRPRRSHRDQFRRDRPHATARLRCCRVLSCPRAAVLAIKTDFVTTEVPENTGVTTKNYSLSCCLTKNIDIYIGHLLFSYAYLCVFVYVSLLTE
jgi:hypothetical protein